MSQFVYHAYSWPFYSYVSETTIIICSHVQSLIIVLYCWMAGSSTWFFITPILGWNYNVFRPSCYPSNLAHWGAYVISNFTTLGISSFYGVSLSLCRLFGTPLLSTTLILQRIPLKIHLLWVYMGQKFIDCVYTHLVQL